MLEKIYAGACTGDYTISRTFTVSDDCGNAVIQTQTITIVDTTSPVYSFVPSDYTIECSEEIVLDEENINEDDDEPKDKFLEFKLATILRDKVENPEFKI